MDSEPTVPASVPAHVRFPVELWPPQGFRPDDPSSWPKVEGRIEYVAGKLIYMPPCGGIQQVVTVDVAYVLRQWADAHGDYIVGGNEAGMVLGPDVRAADAAVWRRDAVGPMSHQFHRTPPILAVEVSGRDEGEAELRDKARWYLDAGVQVVWLVLPDSREVVVLTREGDARLGAGDRIAEHRELPGLAPAVRSLFAQLDG
jgi:Uma2 family endonuclease